MALNKQRSAAEVVAQLRSGMTIGIGGWGPRRKPMTLVRELLRSDIRDLTVVSYGGPEVGMLCAAGKVRKLVYGFVTMDAIPLEPYFRKAREAGQIEVMELDEGMFEWGLRAAGMRMSFLPTRVGLATDVLARNPQIKTITSPYDDGEVYVAMPALKLDAALLHVNDADRWGNTTRCSTTCSRVPPTPATSAASACTTSSNSTRRPLASTCSNATWCAAWFTHRAARTRPTTVPTTAGIWTT